MKSLRTLVLTTVVLAFASSLAASDFGIRAGRVDDTDEEFVGVEVVVGLGAIKLNPNIEYSLADNVTAGSANVDITYDLVQIATARPYVGAGLGLSYFDNDGGQSETDVVGNLVGGVAFQLDFLTPYAQVKYFRRLESNDGAAGDDISFAVGLRF